jgi:hypothetical protein
MLNVIMLNVIMLNVVMLNVITLNVVAPLSKQNIGIKTIYSSAPPFLES